MGLLELLRPKSPLEKASKQVREPFAQPEIRREAMDKLLEIATPEAYEAVLKRWTFNAHGQIADESEKLYLVDRVAETEAALPALKAYIQKEKNLSHAIQALSRMCTKEEQIEILLGALRSYVPLDHRSTEPKLHLLIALADIATPEQYEWFEPYLSDHHDDVQFQALVALEKLAAPEARAAVANVVKGDAHSSRIQRRAAQVAVACGYSMREHYAEFSDELKGEYLLGKKGQLVVRGARPA